jgi:hypothetical protein
MPQRLAAVMALLVFAVCLITGGISVGNPFTTTVERALQAMAVTFAVALIVGFMGQKMVEESIKNGKGKLPELQAKPKQSDR